MDYLNGLRMLKRLIVSYVMHSRLTIVSVDDVNFFRIDVAVANVTLLCW